MNILKSVLTYLFRKYCLEKHKYLPSTLVKRKRSSIVYEVEANFYTKDFEPVLVIRPYDGSGLFSVTGKEIEELEEHKSEAPGDIRAY